MSMLLNAVRKTSRSTRLVFANPNLRRVNLALAGSMVGDGASSIAVIVFAYGFGGASTVGAFVAIRLALIALTLPFLSILVDRLPRRPFLITADLLRVGLFAGAAAVIWLSGPPVLVLVLSVVAGLVGAPFRPAQSALIPSISSTPHELTAANAVSSTLESLSFFVGPAIGGVLLAFADVPVVFLVNAATFVWSAMLLSGLVVDEGQALAEPGGDGSDDSVSSSFLLESVAGFSVLGRDPRLLLIGALGCAQIVVSGALTVFTVVIAVDVVRLGPAGVGYLESVLGIGAILGGLVAIGRSARGSVAVDFGAGVIGWALPLLLVAAWPSAISTFVAFALIGGANPLVDVNMATLIQRLTPGALLGRVFGALESALIASMALGAFVMPLLIHSVGLRWGLVIISAPITAAAVLTWPALRRIDRTVAAPDHLGLLQALPLFQPLGPSVLEGLARRLATAQVPMGEVVIQEGAIGDRFYLIGAGGFDALRGAERLSHMGPGDCFGEIALLRDVPRTASVVAVENSVVHSLERDDFLAALGAEPEAASRAEVLVNRRIAR